MKKRGKHYSRTLSDRLARVLSFIEKRGARGASTFEIQAGARVCDVKDAIFELRKRHRVEIVGATDPFARDRPVKHRRFWLYRFVPVGVGSARAARV